MHHPSMLCLSFDFAVTSELQTPPVVPLEDLSQSHRTPSVSEHSREGYGISVPVTIAPSPPQHGGMLGSELTVHERDTRRVSVSHSQLELPPDYRTVYSDS